MILHLVAEPVVESFAIHQAEEELVEELLVVGWVTVVAPKILQEVLLQKCLAVQLRNRLLKISSDMISLFPCSQLFAVNSHPNILTILPDMDDILYHLLLHVVQVVSAFLTQV